MFNFSGSFRWDDSRDILLLREIRMQEPYLERVGSKEAGMKWTSVASTLNTHLTFKDSARDQRSVRDRFTKLFSEFKAKIREEEGSSGTNPPDLSEKEKLLEEIKETIDSNQSDKQTKSSSAENERTKALSMREKAMTTWSKTKFKTLDDESDSDEESSTNSSDADSKRKRKKRKRGSSDALEYIQKKFTSEYDLKKQEMEMRKEQFKLEQEKVEMEKKRQEQMQDLVIQQQRQMAAQQQQQQQQIQQQMELQSQVIALLAKLSK